MVSLFRARPGPLVPVTASLPVKEAILPMAFVVICTTVMTYFLNGYALSKITSTEVAVFMYLQPIIGIVFAIFTKSDTISLTK